MTDDRMFERDVHAWLELGPRRAPARVVQKALQIIAMTPQQRDLRILWRFPHLTLNKRFAAVAVVVLVVVSAGLLLLRNPQSQIGNPSPSPSPTASLSSSPITFEQLQGSWASVGTRSDPIGNHANQPLHESMAIDAVGLRIATFRGDVYSSLSISQPGGQISMQMNAPQDMLTRQWWDCTTGDTGTYVASLSPDKQTLTMSSESDACTTRSDILAGYWSRWSCPDPAQYSYCDHATELAPGRYVSDVFKPFASASSGHLAYTLPTGWAMLTQPPTWQAPYSAFQVWLTKFDAPNDHVIDIYSNFRPINAGAVPSSPTPTCAPVEPVPPGTAAQLADFLATLPYLAISNRTPVTIGGLAGVQLDLSLLPNFIDPCSYGTNGIGQTTYSTYLELFQGPNAMGIYKDSKQDAYARFIILDVPGGHDVVEVSAPDSATLAARLTDAMPVIQSFEFTR